MQAVALSVYFFSPLTKSCVTVENLPPSHVVINGVFFRGVILEHCALLKIPRGALTDLKEPAAVKVAYLAYVISLGLTVHKFDTVAEVALIYSVTRCPHIVIREEIVIPVVGGYYLNLVTKIA